MNGLPVEKQTFVEAKDEKTYRALQYDLLSHIWESQKTCRVEHDSKIQEIEKKHKNDKTKNMLVQGVSAAGGGALTAWAFVKAYLVSLVDK